MGGKWLFIPAVAAVLAGCASVNEPGPSAAYRAAYEATDYKKAGGLAPGGAEEKKAVERFKDFFGNLSEQNVRAKVRDVYAADVYFNDTLKEISGVDALEAYLLRTAENVESCTVDIQDVASHGGDYYFRWTMYIKFKKFKKGQVQPSIGMTHIRFNKEGRISFHQDYWDAASNLFEKVPLVGGLIRSIKKRL